jgi:tetratricopeptide (TPR) repeat protein
MLALDAIHALGRLGAKEAVPALVDLFGREWPLAVTSATSSRPHFDAVVQLTLALGRLSDPSAISPLLRKLLSEELSRDFAALSAKPPRGQRNLLTALISGLVRFSDEDLADAARREAERLADSHALYRLEERYLRYLADLFADPRKGGIRRPQPRRQMAAVVSGLVLEVIPRESTSDLDAREDLAWHEAARRRFDAAAAHMARAGELRRLLYPLDFAEKEGYYLARTDLLGGIARMEGGEVEKGKALYAKGVQRDPEDPQVLNLFAWWLAETGRELPGALNAALSAGRRSPSDPNILDTLGWVLFRMGRTKEAIDHLAAARVIDARREDPAEDRFRSPLILFHLAAALAADARIEDARAVLTEAISLDDTIATAAREAPWFAPLREAGVLEETIEKALADLPP